MSDRFFQDLLDIGLLTELGDAPERLDALRESAQDLAQSLAAPDRRADTIPLTLVGLDPQAGENDPAFESVASAVIEHWPTYRNAFPQGTPRQLLRAVALEAVRQAAAVDNRIASVAWYTAANALPFADLGPSRPTVEGMFLAIGRRVEGASVAAWGRVENDGGFRMPPRTTATASEFAPPQLTGSLFNDTFLEALSKHTASLQVNGNYTNDASGWATAFAPQLANAVTIAVNTGLKALADMLNEASLLTTEGIKTFAEETGNSVRASIVAASVASAGQELRTKLLWWHQTLYSPSLQQSYREMDPTRAAIAIATDAYRLVPTPSPQAVEHLVRETVRVAAPNASSMSGVTFVREARDHLDVWEGDYELSHAPRGRALMLTAALGSDDPAAHLGPLANSTIPLADLAAHTFRDLSAARSAAVGS